MHILGNACRPVYSLTHVCMSDGRVHCSQPRAFSTLRMQTDIVEWPELTAAIQELLPALDGIKVTSVSIFPNARPGEPRFWTAYAYRDGRRNVFSTSELRHLPLAEQVPNLCEQLQTFVASKARADILFLGISGVLHPSASLYLLARGVQPWGNGHARYEGVPVLAQALAPYPLVRILLTSTQPWKHGLAAVTADLGSLGARVDGFTFEVLTKAGMGPDDYWRLDKSGIVAATAELLTPRAWAAIDDEGMRWPLEVREHQLVRTDGCEGLLTEEIRDRLHAVLARNFQR